MFVATVIYIYLDIVFPAICLSRLFECDLFLESDFPKIGPSGVAGNALTGTKEEKNRTPVIG